MPYIDPDRREEILNPRTDASFRDPYTVGELTFAIVKLCNDHLERKRTGFGPRELRFEDYATIMGVISCVQHEFYRKAVSVYEDQKIDSEGDLDWPVPQPSSPIGS